MDKLVYPLNGTYRFHLGEEPDAWQAWYPDADPSWQDVSLPHDWSVFLPFSRDYSSGTGYLAGGIGWYRIAIPPKEEWRGKRISICFDGIYKNSRVWCNSYYLGERPNGYISFSYDITEQFSFDHDNMLCVRVDRTELSDSRWFTGSGIIRKVSLIIEEAVHPTFGGIFFTTPGVSEREASLEISNELVNTASKELTVTVTNTLLDAEKSPVCSLSASALIPAGEKALLVTSGQLASPHLWSPDMPYLYTLSTQISFQSSFLGQTPQIFTSVADIQRVGIRSILFDADKGFFLNGVPALFKGVCLHHDAGVLGAAVYKEVWQRRLSKLKAMGCNAIRMSHNPHMPELYELCDEMGFLVMDEAFDEWEGPKNKWWQGHNVYPPRNQGYYTAFPQWHEKDLTDLILRDRNHPSIVMWSIGNEIDYPNDPYCHPSFSAMTGNNDANKPAQERQYNPMRPNAERLAPLAKELTQIVKKADHTRPVTLAAAFPELSAKLGFLDSLDVAGYNYKEHLYEESHRAFPYKPFLGSENGHSLSAWKAVTDKPYISGQFLWTGIDYLGEAHGWPIHGSYAGLLTLAGFEKTGYYRRQSLWSEKPCVHLATCFAPENPEESQNEFLPVFESWNYLPGEEVLIKCYTNQSEVELVLNSISLGTFTKNPDKDCIMLTVPFEPGQLSARCVKNGVCVASHKLETTGPACQIHVEEWQTFVADASYATGSHDTASFGKSAAPTGTLIHDMSAYPQVPEGGRISAPSIHQLEVSMLDNKGCPVCFDSSLLTVTVENGTLLGLENGDLADVTDYTSSSRRAYKGRLLIYVRPEIPVSGTMTVPTVVKVSAEGMHTSVYLLDLTTKYI